MNGTKRVFVRKATMRILLLAVLSLTSSPCDAFTFPHTSSNTASIAISRRSSFSYQSKLEQRSSPRVNTRLSLSLDDIIYNAQSTANNLAATSLSSTTVSITSLAVLYFAGLLTSFSPCSLGLLPLTMSYISNAADQRQDKAVLLPTIAFASGLAVVFCTFGLVSSFVGGVFGSTSSDNIWGQFLLASLSSGIAIAMGLQLLELIDLPLPSLNISLDDSMNQNKNQGRSDIVCTDNVCYSTSSDGSISNEVSFDTSDGLVTAISSEEGAMAIPLETIETKSPTEDVNSLFRTFLLGGSSALVASPCATPVLTSILGFVAAAQDPALGAILLFTYTVGYSTPLLAIAASGGQALVNLQNSNVDENSLVGKLGQIVNPLTASVLIWYGVNGFLGALFGDPSLAGLAPIIE